MKNFIQNAFKPENRIVRTRMVHRLKRGPDGRAVYGKHIGIDLTDENVTLYVPDVRTRRNTNGVAVALEYRAKTDSADPNFKHPGWYAHVWTDDPSGQPTVIFLGPTPNGKGNA